MMSQKDRQAALIALQRAISPRILHFESTLCCNISKETTFSSVKELKHTAWQYKI